MYNNQAFKTDWLSLKLKMFIKILYACGLFAKKTASKFTLDAVSLSLNKNYII